MFDWDDIQVFLAVSRAGTVRGAARKLGITHATVSRRLRNLEERLGAQLFDRMGNRHRLSAVGRSILATAQQAEGRMAEIDRRAFAQDTRLAGVVRLSLLGSLFLAVLHPHLKRFQDRYPMIQVELLTTDYLSNLARREADIVIRITNHPPDSAVGRKLADSPLACFAAPEYLAQRPDLDSWIALTHEPAAKPVLPARTVMTVNSLAVAAAVIRAGHGIGMLPCFIGDGDPGLVRMPGTSLVPDMEIWALMHADVRSMPRVRVLMDFLYEVLAADKDRIEGRKGTKSPKS